jgi:multidrug efflux pump subunit AcrA (membrane-fusion protein)
MLLRISLIVAILAGIGAGVVSYIEITDKVPALVKQRDDEKDLKLAKIDELHKTNAILVKTTFELKQTKEELAETQSARDKAIARAEDQTKRADELNDKLTKAMQERDDAQNQLAAYKATDLTPEQVLKLNKNLKDAYAQIDAINTEKQILQRTLTSTKAELGKFKGENPDIMLRADLKGKVMVVDPKWDFVVLNVGEDQGAIQDGELLVSRSGKLVAKVIIRSVQKDRCIANVMPGWKLGEPVEGDEATPAHPAS